MGLLSPHDVQRAIVAIAQLLAGEGVPARLHIMGGAAVALMNPVREATRDIDGFIEPPPADAVRREVADSLARDGSRFDEGATGFRPPVAGLEEWHEVHRLGIVSVYIPCPEMLLAMKLHAARLRDSADIEFLAGRCDVTAVAEAARIYERYYPGETLSDAAHARLEQWIARSRDS